METSQFLQPITSAMPVQVGEVHVTNAMAELDHVYMPAFPLCRDLPIFEASSQKSVDGESCSKFHRYHNQLTPGIFTFFCAHGLCVGFKFMVNKEGPATAFELFLTRLQAGNDGHSLEKDTSVLTCCVTRE